MDIHGWNSVNTYEGFIRMLLLGTGFVDEQNLSITRNENDGSILVNVPINAGNVYQTVAFELPDPSNLSDSYDCVSYIQGNGSGYNNYTRQLYISEMRDNNPNTIGIFSTSFSNPEVPDRINEILDIFRDNLHYNIDRRVAIGFSDGGINACRELAGSNGENDFLIVYDSSNYPKALSNEVLTGLNNNNTPFVFVSCKAPNNIKFKNKFLDLLKTGVSVYFININENLHNEGIIRTQYQYLINDYLLNGGDLSSFKPGINFYRYELQYDSRGREQIVPVQLDVTEDEFLSYLTIRSDNAYLANELVQIDISRKRMNKEGSKSTSFNSTTSIPNDEISFVKDIDNIVSELSDKLEKEIRAVAKVGDSINELDYELTQDEYKLIKDLDEESIEIKKNFANYLEIIHINDEGNTALL